MYVSQNICPDFCCTVLHTCCTGHIFTKNIFKDKFAQRAAGPGGFQRECSLIKARLVLKANLCALLKQEIQEQAEGSKCIMSRLGHVEQSLAPWPKKVLPLPSLALLNTESLVIFMKVCFPGGVWVWVWPILIFILFVFPTDKFQVPH